MRKSCNDGRTSRFCQFILEVQVLDLLYPHLFSIYRKKIKKLVMYIYGVSRPVHSYIKIIASFKQRKDRSIEEDMHKFEAKLFMYLFICFRHIPLEVDVLVRFYPKFE
jgi:hypothetical protein